MAEKQIKSVSIGGLDIPVSGVELPVSIENGGTGATNAKVGVYNLGIKDYVTGYDLTAMTQSITATSTCWNMIEHSTRLIEFFGRVSVTVNCNKSWGSLYYGEVPSLQFPSTLSVTPCVCMHLFNNNAWVIGGNPQTNETGKMFIVTTESQTITGDLHIHVIGNL